MSPIRNNMIPSRWSLLPIPPECKIDIWIVPNVRENRSDVFISIYSDVKRHRGHLQLCLDARTITNPDSTKQELKKLVTDYANAEEQTRIISKITTQWHSIWNRITRAIILDRHSHETHYTREKE